MQKKLIKPLRYFCDFQKTAQNKTTANRQKFGTTAIDRPTID
jgi:hypothetical protein